MSKKTKKTKPPANLDRAASIADAERNFTVLSWLAASGMGEMMGEGEAYNLCQFYLELQHAHNVFPAADSNYQDLIPFSCLVASVTVEDLRRVAGAVSESRHDGEGNPIYAVIIQDVKFRLEGYMDAIGAWDREARPGSEHYDYSQEKVAPSMRVL